MTRVRISLKLAGCLILAALAGLIVSVGFNLIQFGRADQRLLQAFGQMASMSIDCENPRKSEIFKSPNRMFGGHMQVNLLLYDSQQQLLIQRWELGSENRSLPKKKDIDERINSFLWQPIFHDDGQWIKESDVCGKGWTLYLNDLRNTAFKELIFGRQSSLFLHTSVFLIVIVLAVAAYLRSKGNEANLVLKKFAEGQLDARLLVQPWELSFDLIGEFNKMCEKVASLVQRIQCLEVQRSQDLEDLAHDTRTPISSLMAAMDTLQEFRHRLTEKQVTDLLLHMKEDITYFRRLLDDLFLLASIDSRQSSEQFSSVDLKELIRQCWQSINEIHHENISIQIDLVEPRNQLALIFGDPYYLKRMFVNFFENARRYALSHISLILKRSDHSWIVEIKNDSQIMSPEMLESWGKKRQRRLLGADRCQPHISLGLGSSIGCRIAEMHGGQASIYQESDPHKSISLVTVTIELPIKPDR